VSLPGAVPAGLTLRPVTEEPLVAVAQPGHPLAGRPASLAQIAGEPFIEICDHTFSWVISVATPSGRRRSAQFGTAWPATLLQPVEATQKSTEADLTYA
jgi:DNA-binding transcriptional LysR family regulator